MPPPATFDEVLDAIEHLPPEQQADLLHVIQRRLANAQGEIGKIIHYDYYVVNREVKEAVRSLSAIVEAERARISRVSEWRLEALRRNASR